MLRKCIRERKHFLVKKHLEKHIHSVREKKEKLRNLIESDKNFDPSLKEDYEKYAHILDLDDHEVINNNLKDDEYINVGNYEPRIVITTSRDPTSRLKVFAKELRLMFPNAQRINRGKLSINGLLEFCRKSNISDLVMVNETRGTPDCLIISHLPNGPTAYFYITDIVLRHDLEVKIPNASEAIPHLIFDNFTSKVGKRVSDVLKYLFPVVKSESRRCVSFINYNDFILVRNYVYTEQKKIELMEQGPRMTLRIFKIMLGTIDMKHAETEWVLHVHSTTNKLVL